MRKEELKELLEAPNIKFNPNKETHIEFLYNIIAKADCKQFEKLLAQDSVKQFLSQDNNKSTALLTAIESGNQEFVKLLIDKYSPDINALTKNGQDSQSNYSALHYAVEQGKIEIVRILIENNADPSLKSGSGSMPIHYSTDPEITKILIEKMDHKSLSEIKAEIKSHLEDKDMQQFLSFVAEKKGENFLAGLIAQDGASRSDLVESPSNVVDLSGCTSLDRIAPYQAS